MFPYLIHAQEICNNGIDDDNNGLTDIFDPSCNSSCFTWLNFNNTSNTQMDILSNGTIIGDVDYITTDPVVAFTNNSNYNFSNNNFFYPNIIPDSGFAVYPTITGNSFNIHFNNPLNTGLIIQLTQLCNTITFNTPFIVVKNVGFNVFGNSLDGSMLCGSTFDANASLYFAGPIQDINFQFDGFIIDGLGIAFNIPLSAPIQKDSTLNFCYGEFTTLPNGVIIDSSCVFNYSIQNLQGCDSILYKYTIIEGAKPFTDSIHINLCNNDSYTLPDGTIVSATGKYFHTFKNKQNCDSLVKKYIITKSEPLLVNKNVSICEGDSSILEGGETTTQAGNYTFIYKNIKNCDSVKVNTYVSTHTCTDIIVPNGFTPNGDGVNDDIKPLFINLKSYKNYVFYIYNRWGEKVFETNDIKKGWDGKYKNSLAELGTYFYYLKIEIGGNKEMLKGDVILVR
jgi:gliding motility-associated-like protein